MGMLIWHLIGGGPQSPQPARIPYVPTFIGSGNIETDIHDDDHATYVDYATGTQNQAIDIYNLGSGTYGDYILDRLVLYFLSLDPGTPGNYKYPALMRWDAIRGSVTVTDFSGAVATGRTQGVHSEYRISVDMGDVVTPSLVVAMTSETGRLIAITEMHIYGMRVADRIAYTPTYTMASFASYSGSVNNGVRNRFPVGAGDPENRGYLHQTVADRSEAIMLTLPSSTVVTKMRVFYAGTGTSGVFVPGSITAKLNGVTYSAVMADSLAVGNNDFATLYVIDIEIPDITATVVYFGFTQTTSATNHTTMFSEIEVYGNPV